MILCKHLTRIDLVSLKSVCRIYINNLQSIFLLIYKKLNKTTIPSLHNPKSSRSKEDAVFPRRVLLINQLNSVHRHTTSTQTDLDGGWEPRPCVFLSLSYLEVIKITLSPLLLPLGEVRDLP